MQCNLAYGSSLLNKQQAFLLVFQDVICCSYLCLVEGQGRPLNGKSLHGSSGRTCAQTATIAQSSSVCTKLTYEQLKIAFPRSCTAPKFLAQVWVRKQQSTQDFDRVLYKMNLETSNGHFLSERFKVKVDTLLVHPHGLTVRARIWRILSKTEVHSVVLNRTSVQ